MRSCRLQFCLQWLLGSFLLHSWSDARIIGTCRSNATHVAWSETGQQHPSFPAVDASSERRSLTTTAATTDDECRYQTLQEARLDALAYLRDNLMAFDVPYTETLGFVDGDDRGADGLDYGLVDPTVKLAMDAKVQYPWADSVPQSIYYEYALNYASVNEARTNWRPLVSSAVKPILKALPRDAQVNDVVRAINTHVWRALASGGNETSIVFKAEQTPLIFDPMSILAYGYASCTGLAILFICTLRAAGVPARLAGTPAWKGKRENGNHNWVEVYRDGRWDFCEPSASFDPDWVDDLDTDPCKRWFCSPGSDFGETRVYAARLDGAQSDTFYRMAWEWNNTDVPGVDRTDYYVNACSHC